MGSCVSQQSGNECGRAKGLHDCYGNAARCDGGLDSCGVYFGTTGGQVYGSSDAGDNWAPIVRDLPAVLSVEAQTLA
jgi:hypothetical protein